MAFLLSWTAHAQMTIKKQLNLGTDYVAFIDVTATPDSVPNGNFSLVYKSKTLVKGIYKNGIKNGEWTSYHSNGAQRLKANYLDGKPHGTWKYTDEKGAVVAKLSFNKGKAVGHWQGYYPSHNKAIDLVYLPNGSPSQCIHYFSDKMVALNHEFTYENQDTTTLLSYYYRNYNLFHYETKLNGQLHGIFETLHSNAVTWEKLEYANGKLVKVHESRSTGGIPRKNTDFIDGSGVVTRYHYTGNKFSETTYKNGMKNGKVQIFDLGGNALGNGAFKNNAATGEWEVYSKYHKLLRLIDFDTLHPGVMEVNFVSAAPKETEQGPYLHGYKHGTWKSFDAYGELVSQTEYAFGYPHGEYVYYEGQKLKQQQQFVYGNKTGLSVRFDPFGKTLSEENFVSNTRIDSNWHVSPAKGYVSMYSNQKTSNRKLLFFVPELPGVETLIDPLPLRDQKEQIFPIKRTYGYSYTPELVLPKFQGGPFAEKDYIRKNLVFSDELKKQRINGTLLVRYKVNELGMIEEAELLKTIWPALDEMVLQLVRNLPPHHPATFNGLPIPSYVVREIDITL